MSACTSVCVCMSIYFEHENICNLDDHSRLQLCNLRLQLKVMNCARSILQIHAVQAQLGSHCCSVLFLSLIFPYCTSHSCYSTPSPFTQIQKNVSVLRIPGADFRTYSTVIELYLFQTTKSSLGFGMFFGGSIFLLVTPIPFLILQIELSYRSP